MALQVASNVLTDSGYSDKYFDRERTSVVIGASGGTGDVGLQYGLRAELPRFTGDDIPPKFAGHSPNGLKILCWNSGQCHSRKNC